MSLATSNVLTTDTFQVWFNRTNTLLDILSNQAVTANSTTSNTTGNAQLIGVFGANTIAVTGSLRGGNVSSSDILTIDSALNITGASLQMSNTEVINSTAGWVGDFVTTANVSGAYGIFSANVSGVSGLFTTTVNTATFSVGSSFTANSTVANAVSLRVSSNFIANATHLVTTGNVHMSDNKILRLGTSGDATLTYSTSENAVVLDLLTSNETVIMKENGNTRFTFASNTGDFTAVGDLIAFSDASVKDDVYTIYDPINKIMNMRGVTYTRTDLNDPYKRHMGFLAQELRNSVPEVVHVNEDGFMSVAYGNITALLVEAIKSLHNEVQELKTQR